MDPVAHHMIAAVVTLLAAGRALSAQQGTRPAAPTRVPVTIALVDRVPTTAGRYVLHRRSELTPHDVILLGRDATAQDLSEALQALLAVRQVDGDTALTSRILRVRPEQPVRARREFPWVPRTFSELRNQPPRNVAGVGTVPAIEIWLPPMHRGRRVSPLP